MSVEAWRHVLGDGLVVSLALPLAPSDRPASPEASVVRLLDLVAVLEDGTREPDPGDRSSPASFQTLQRLEAKVDILTQLVLGVLRVRIPEPVPLSISSEGLVAPGELLPIDCRRVELYPCSWLYEPLVLELGTVSAHDGRHGALWQSRDPALREALGRWVFRMHRRELARRRLRPAGEGVDDAGGP